ERLQTEAEKERDSATRERGVAESERERTAAAEAEAQKQRLRAEGLVYAGQLGQAQLAWQEGDVQRARDLLAGRGVDHRGWDYDHLRQRFDESQVTLRGHTADVTGVAFSPDGTRLASGSRDGTVKVWEAATGRELLSLKGHTSFVSCVAFSPD